MASLTKTSLLMLSKGAPPKSYYSTISGSNVKENRTKMRLEEEEEEEEGS